MSTPVFIACCVTAAIALFLAVSFIKPVKGLFLLILNSAVGWAGLYIFNKLFAFCSFAIGMNIASASVAGILGLPGVALMAVVKLLYKA